MAKAPRFQRTTQVQTGPVNTGAGVAESTLAGVLEGFAEQLSARADRRAGEASFLEGQLSEDAEFTGSENTIRGRAFNAGVMASQQAAQQTDLRGSIASFENENSADPDTFQAKVDGLLEGMLEGSDARLHPFITQRAADYSGRAKTRIIARQQDALTKEATADLQRGVEGMVEDATTAAFEGDILMIETRRQELEQLLQTGVNGGLVSEGDAGDIFDKFERDITSNEVLGIFDKLVRDEGVAAGNEGIKRWQKKKASSLGLTSDDHEDITRKMFARRNQQASLEANTGATRNAALRADVTERTGRINDTASVLRDGFPIDKEQSDQVTEDIRFLLSSDDPVQQQKAKDLARDFDTANIIQGQVSVFRAMPEAAREDELNQLESVLRADGASAESVTLFKSLETTHADITREVDEDPRGYKQRNNQVEDGEIDFSSAQKLQESFSDRAVTYSDFDRADPKITAGEADQLANIFSEAEVEEKVALLGIITSGSEDAAAATLEQIDDKGHSQMALMGAFVMEGRGSLAREVLRGQMVLNGEPAVKPTPALLQLRLDNVWKGAMTDDFNIDRRATFREAAIAKYAELKMRLGDVSAVFNQGLMDQALKEVMPTAKFNGRRVAIPSFATEDRFDDWVDSWDELTFLGVAGGVDDSDRFEDQKDTGELLDFTGLTASAMLDLVRDKGRLVELGNGQYGVEVKSAATDLGKPLVSHSGRPWIINLPNPGK